MNGQTADPNVSPSSVRDGPRAFNLSIAGLFALGISLRLWHYTARRSLWIDEARLALNIGARDFAGLVRPLDYDQAAPPLFLAVEKLATSVIGMSELSLRLFPMIAGIAVLFLTFWLVRPLVSHRETAIVTTITAISPVLVYYSNEVKPYIVDAAVAATLVLLARVAAAKPTQTNVVGLSTAGVLAILLSTPSVFVLSGVGASWFFTRRTQRLRWPHALMIAVPAGITLACAYFLVYRGNVASPYLKVFWGYRLLDPFQPEWAPRIWFAIREIVTVLLTGKATDRDIGLLWRYLSHSFTAVGLLLIALGTVRIRRRVGPFQAALIVNPVVMVFAASFVGLYPIALRLTLYAAPFLLLLVVAGGTELIVCLRGAEYRLLASTVLLSALASSPYFTALAAIDPHGRENSRPHIAALTRSLRSDESVYIDAGSLPAWIFYSTDWGNPDRARLAFAARVGSSGGPAFENAAPRRRHVANEGDELIYDGPYGPEVYGLFTGLQWRWGRGLAQQTPDSGWTANESRRMMLRSDKQWWALFVRDFGSSALLRSAFESAGAKETMQRRSGLVQLVRYNRE